MSMELKVKKLEDKRVEALAEEKKVSEEMIESSLNYDLLSKEEKDAIDEFNDMIDINRCFIGRNL